MGHLSDTSATDREVMRELGRRLAALRIGKTRALLPGWDNVKGRSRPVNLRSQASVGDQACAQTFVMLERDERMRRWAVVGERDGPSNERGQRHGGGALSLTATDRTRIPQWHTTGRRAAARRRYAR